MKKLLFVIFWFVPVLCFSQSVNLSFPSIQAWGDTPDMISASVEYKDVGIMGVAPIKKAIDKHGNETYSNIGIYWKALNVENVLRVGGIYFYNDFPTKSGQNFNFIIELGYSINWVRVSYVHISNAHLSDFNPGIDFFQLTFKL